MSMTFGVKWQHVVLDCLNQKARLQIKKLLRVVLRDILGLAEIVGKVVEFLKGQFDQGWDKVREETLARQIKLGVVPANTVLTPRPKEIPAWDSLNDDQKKVYARMMEVKTRASSGVPEPVGIAMGSQRLAVLRRELGFGLKPACLVSWNLSLVVTFQWE